MDISKYIYAKEYSLNDILSNKKYTVDYFQREYKWQQENIEQLIQDLTNAFLDNYKDGDSTEDVAGYDVYYMGSIVLSDKKTTVSIIDGQQRITSLTLLLIYLFHATHEEMSEQIASLIYSDTYGKKSFNLQVPEREECLKELYEHGEYAPKETDDESIRNMVERYQDINNCFPSDLINGDLLRSFVYWVKENLVLVKITAMSEDNAYTIFETMNDRGVPLTSTDMLKGFILSKFRHDEKRNVFNAQWRADMRTLSEYDGNNTDSQFFQAWLRSQFAISIRPSAAGSVNMDFENIGKHFHNWFKDNYDKGLLATAINGDIENFMETNYKFFLRQFNRIKKAEQSYKKETEHIYYHQFWSVAPSLVYQLYLAPLVMGDDDATCDKKFELVARYLDNFAVRRSTNYRLFGANSIRYTMCNLTKTIRNKPVEELRQTLIQETETIADFQESLLEFRMHGQNKRFIRYFLSRITAFIEEESGMGNNFLRYMVNPNGKQFEIEHIWSDHYEWHTDEFNQTEEFNQARNSIGDLILLPNGTNQSLNDMTVQQKLPHYIKENLLAQSMCAQTYVNNPNFISFTHRTGLKFKSYNDFKKADIKERTLLYASIAEIIWSKDLQ